jgi:hypothetical protein
MLYNYELEQLTEDELAMLWLIITKQGNKPELWENINSVRKEYIVQYIMKNKSKFTEKGVATFKDLMKKLTHIENPISG